VEKGKERREGQEGVRGVRSRGEGWVGEGEEE